MNNNIGLFIKVNQELWIQLKSYRRLEFKCDVNNVMITMSSIQFWVLKYLNTTESS